MSNTARKARKRFNQKVRDIGDTEALPYLHPVKVGTPVPERVENQPFAHVNPSNGKIINRVSAAGRKRLREYEERHPKKAKRSHRKKVA